MAAIPKSPSDLNRLSLRQFRALFATLPVPQPESLPGTYRAAFVGPGWLRASAGPALVLSGLGGWCGKEFFTDGGAVNLVRRGGQLSTRFPMRLAQTLSFIDQRDGLALHYRPGSPFPWMFVIDELRRLDSTALLGMTIANLPGLRGLALPFLLERTE